MIRIPVADVRALFKGGRSAAAALIRMGLALERYDAEQPRAIDPYKVEINGKSYEVTSLTYHLRGRIPVKVERFRDGGCSCVAFSPLHGGFVRSNRYYYSQRDEDQPLNLAEYEAAVQRLKKEFA